MARTPHGQALPAAVGGGMGVCGARRHDDELQLRRRRGPALRARALRRSRLTIPMARWMPQRTDQLWTCARRCVQTQRLGLFRHARQCLGMGGGLLDGGPERDPIRRIRLHPRGRLRDRRRSRRRLGRRISKGARRRSDLPVPTTLRYYHMGLRVALTLGSP